eukprot:scaffold31709_cov118-Isochrysis_galbana.AAC.2
MPTFTLSSASRWTWTWTWTWSRIPTRPSLLRPSPSHGEPNDSLVHVWDMPAATRAATSTGTGGWTVSAKPSGRLAGCRLYWASACTRPATAWLTLGVSSCAADAVNSPAGCLPDWADVDAATARSRARMAPRRCPLSASDMRKSRCVLKNGYNYITLLLKLITRPS